MNFRKDINGLRAFAVIAVVLFHFNSSWMPGGFAGVDVFFVISGFLMTGIIFKGIEQERFSILNFYVARANRIIPALAVLCLFLMAFGWFYLTPPEYKALGKHAASSIGFVSNIIYMREAGYFDEASNAKWLLHTWTLSVEWQFYIIYPLIILALKRFFSLKTLRLLIIVSTLLSFIFSVYATYKWPSASYYLFPMRAWEMLLGGVAFLYPFKLKDNNKKLVEILGLILIIGSYILISEDNPWPGYLALFPVLGSFLVIQAQHNESIITGNIVFQKLGTWSYSIYLWHWPFVVAIYTFLLPSEYTYIGMILSVLFGFLSYKYIERINFPRSFPSLLSYLKCKPIYIAGLVGLLGSVLFLKQNSFTETRFSDEKLLIIDQQERNSREAECTAKSRNGEFPPCKYGNGPVKAIVIGDSHANAQMVSIGERASLAGGSILSIAVDGCPTVEGVFTVNSVGNNPNYGCANYIKKTMDLVTTKYAGIPIIIINRTSGYIHGEELSKFKEPQDTYVAINNYPEFQVNKIFKKRTYDYTKNLTAHMLDTICKISKTNSVYLMRPTPSMHQLVPKTMVNSLILTGNLEHIKINRSEFNRVNEVAIKMQDAASSRCGAKILDATPLLCDKNYCYGDKNEVPLYFDRHHLSKYGSQIISPIYDEVFK